MEKINSEIEKNGYKLLSDEIKQTKDEYLDLSEKNLLLSLPVKDNKAGFAFRTLITFTCSDIIFLI